MIYNSQNDKRVVSDLMDSYFKQRKEGFSKIVGLRDVYCHEYTEKYNHNYNADGIIDIINSIRGTLSELNNIKDALICFSIMEIEAWLLGLLIVSPNFNSRLELTFKEGYNLSTIDDPEKEMVHPCKNLSNILNSNNFIYKKHWKYIKSFIFRIEKEDFKQLYESSICNSFNEFVDTILK